MSFSVKTNPNIDDIINAPYPFDVVDANKRKAIEKFGPDHIIDFGIGDPSDPTPEAVRDAARKSVDDTKTKGYPASVGQESFKDAVSTYMKRRFDVELEASEIVATYGAKYACFHIPQYFLEPGAGQYCLIPNPGYPPYAAGTLMAGAKPYYLNILGENDYMPELESVPDDVVAKTGVIFVNTPHSPTARTYTREKMRELVDFALDNDIILVSDECYSDIYYGEPPLGMLELPGAEECTIVLGSLSKRSMMTGYAVGFYASKNPDLLKPYASIQRKSIQGVANIIQDAAAAAYLDMEHPKRMREIYRERKDTLVPALEEIGLDVADPQATFFLWAKVPDGETPLSFSEKLLLEKAVNCVPGNLISQEFNGKNPGEDHVRFALVPQIEKIREAVERLTG